MTDLTAITAPFGLLDEVYGPGTQEALRAHGGPYEFYSMNGGWDETPMPGWVGHSVYRVKPAPPKPREFWLTIDSKGQRYFHTMPVRDDDHEVIHVREVLPDQP